MIKTERPNWESNGSVLKGKHLITACTLARTLDNSAIEQNRRTTPDVIKEVTRRLNSLFPHVDFKEGSVSLYVNGVFSDKGIIGDKDQVGRWSTPSYKKELAILRKFLLTIK